MYVCIACMYVCIVCMYVRKYCMYVCMYLYMIGWDGPGHVAACDVCLSACMPACMSVLVCYARLCYVTLCSFLCFVCCLFALPGRTTPVVLRT